MLTLENINLTLGNNLVIRGTAFHVEKGELVCLLGPSGCGKTSTLRLIAGLERPDSGTITIDNRTVSSRDVLLPPHKRKIGFLFQDFALFPHLTVAENIAYGLGDLTKDDATARTIELLEQIRLVRHAHKYPHMLSGGEQQRVALARTRAPRPPLLLLDEPFSALDTSLRGRIREETLRILKERGVTTVMVTHDPEEAMLMADRIVLMKDGGIVQIGTPDELYHRPANAFAAEFSGDINLLQGIVEGAWITTDIGSVANKNFADGSEVDVMIRPDALKLSTDVKASQTARVCDVRYAGGSSLIRMGIGNGFEPHTHIQVRQPGTSDVEEGDRLRIDMDSDQTFVFEKADTLS